MDILLFFFIIPVHKLLFSLNLCYTGWLQSMEHQFGTLGREKTGHHIQRIQAPPHKTQADNPSGDSFWKEQVPASVGMRWALLTLLPEGISVSSALPLSERKQALKNVSWSWTGNTLGMTGRGKYCSPEKLKKQSVPRGRVQEGDGLGEPCGRL